MLKKCIIFFSFFPTVRPLSVEIHSLAVSSAKSEGDNLMFSGHNESWTCIAYGSYPSPSVSWWIDDRFKLDHHEEVRTIFVHRKLKLQILKSFCHRQKFQTAPIDLCHFCAKSYFSADQTATT